MARDRDLPFGLRIGAAHHNWLDIELRLAEHVERLSASAVGGDPVSGLVRFALLAMSERDEPGDVGFWLEPSGFWIVGEMSGSRVELALTFTNSMHSGVARTSHRAPERPVASCTVSRLPLAGAIWRAIRRAESDIRDATRAGAWAHEFPEGEMQVLARGLAERGVLGRDQGNA